MCYSFSNLLNVNWKKKNPEMVKENVSNCYQEGGIYKKKFGKDQPKVLLKKKPGVSSELESKSE